MSRVPSRVLLGVLAAVVLAATGWARGDDDPTTVRQELEAFVIGIEAEREAAIREGLPLSEVEATAFWPLYQEYRVDAGKVTDRMIALLQEYFRLHTSGRIDDPGAERLLRDYLAAEGDDHATRLAYKDRFMKILPATKVVRFFQLDHRLDLRAELALVQEIPLLPVPQQR